jgi:hypothetical protein
MTFIELLYFKYLPNNHQNQLNELNLLYLLTVIACILIITKFFQNQNH